MDGESEEEQESAGTADEEEDGDESDLVTPACADPWVLRAEWEGPPGQRGGAQS